MRKLRALKNVLHHTRADKILISYLIFVLIDALVIWMVDPGIDTYGNSLWYCCTTILTAGYGDEVAITFVFKIATVLLMIYSIAGIIMGRTGRVIRQCEEVLEKQEVR